MYDNDTTTRTTVRSIVLDIADANADALDVHTVAKLASERIADDHEAIIEILPTFVREVLVSRRSTPKMATAPKVDPKAKATSTTTSTAPARSRKVAAIRQTWRDARYATARGYVRTVDLTLFDLDELERKNRALADANAAKAEQWGKVSAAVAEYGVERVGDLPERVLTELFEAVAR